MDADLAEKIKSFLADPSAAEKIASVAQTLSIAPSVPEREHAVQASNVGSNEPIIPKANHSSQLITALRPLIREDKRAKLDSLERAMTVATLFSGIRKRER